MSEPRTCACGHDRNHTMVSAETEHGIFGTIRLMIGGTPTPKRVKFRCRDCNQVFDETVDRAILEQHL